MNSNNFLREIKIMVENGEETNTILKTLELFDISVFGSQMTVIFERERTF